MRLVRLDPVLNLHVYRVVVLGLPLFRIGARSLKILGTFSEWKRCLHYRIMREMRRDDQTARKWTNPMSIYGPDPRALEVTQFNAARREISAATRKSIDELRAHFAEVRERLEREQGNA